MSEYTIYQCAQCGAKFSTKACPMCKPMTEERVRAIVEDAAVTAIDKPLRGVIDSYSKALAKTNAEMREIAQVEARREAMDVLGENAEAMHGIAREESVSVWRSKWMDHPLKVSLEQRARDETLEEAAHIAESFFVKGMIAPKLRSMKSKPAPQPTDPNDDAAWAAYNEKMKPAPKPICPHCIDYDKGGECCNCGESKMEEASKPMEGGVLEPDPAVDEIGWRYPVEKRMHEIAQEEIRNDAIADGCRKIHDAAVRDEALEEAALMCSGPGAPWGKVEALDYIADKIRALKSKPAPEPGAEKPPVFVNWGDKIHCLNEESELGRYAKEIKGLREERDSLLAKLDTQRNAVLEEAAAMFGPGPYWGDGKAIAARIRWMKSAAAAQPIPKPPTVVTGGHSPEMDGPKPGADYTGTASKYDSCVCCGEPVDAIGSVERCPQAGHVGTAQPRAEKPTSSQADHLLAFERGKRIESLEKERDALRRACNNLVGQLFAAQDELSHAQRAGVEELKLKEEARAKLLASQNERNELCHRLEHEIEQFKGADRGRADAIAERDSLRAKLVAAEAAGDRWCERYRVEADKLAAAQEDVAWLNDANDHLVGLAANEGEKEKALDFIRSKIPSDGFTVSLSECEEALISVDAELKRTGRLGGEQKP